MVHSGRSRRVQEVQNYRQALKYGIVPKILYISILNIAQFLEVHY